MNTDALYTFILGIVAAGMLCMEVDDNKPLQVVAVGVIALACSVGAAILVFRPFLDWIF